MKHAVLSALLLATTVAVAQAQTAPNPGTTARQDGHPDLTGNWSVPFGVHPRGFPMMGGSTPWLPLSEEAIRKVHIASLAEIKAMDDTMAAHMQANHGHPAPPPPFDPPPPLTDAGKQVMAHFDVAHDDEHDLSCYPYNVFMRLAGGMGSMTVVQNPKALMMATEINGNNFPRIIYMDGRNADNALESYEGYSVGHWQGDTLVVDITKIKGDTIKFFDHNFWPLSPDAKVTEKFRLLNGGKTLEDMQTLHDPAYYTADMRRVSYMDWRPDLEVRDFPCEEGKEDQVEMHAKAETQP